MINKLFNDPTYKFNKDSEVTKHFGQGYTFQVANNTALFGLLHWA